MSVKGTHLFSEHKLGVMTDELELSLMDHIFRIGRVAISEKSLEQWTEDLMAEFGLEPITLMEDERQVTNESMSVSSDSVSQALFGGSSKAEGHRHVVSIPFTGSEVLFGSEPGVGLSRTAPKGEVEPGRLVLTYVTKDGEEKKFEDALKKDLVFIRKTIKRVNREVAAFNDSQNHVIQERVAARLDGAVVPPRIKPERKVASAEPVAKPIARDEVFRPPNFAFTPGVAEGLADDVTIQDRDKEPEPDEVAEQRIDVSAAETPRGETVVMYIVDLDLVGYSDVAKDLEQSLGAAAVQVLNRQIQAFIENALTRAGLDLAELPVARTGDGAILAFKDATAAMTFAEGVHLATEEHNFGKTAKNAMRNFRVGAAKGEIFLENEYTPSGEVKQIHMAGMPIAIAVRLESAGAPGEILACIETVADLPEELRANFGPEESVKGKRDEVFSARRWRVAPP